MPHTTTLIATIVGGIGLAFILGTIANRLRISPLVGYLLAGVAVGPFTPGYVADQTLAAQLAEIGVILLMFGVGLHFSLKDLLSIRAVVVPGAILQVAASAALGYGLARMLGWSGVGGVAFGIALSVASTVVLMRALQERRLAETARGQITVGWLVMQDLLMVIVLVLLPPLAAAFGDHAKAGAAVDIGALAASLGITFGKVAAFVILMLLVGRRVIPLLLHYVAHTGSRELFRLAVLSVALGVAFAASELFDVSFALGAFFAGMTLSESELSQVAAEESLPFRDAFAVLFFVSVGMLFDPHILIEQPLPILGALLLVVVGNPLIALLAGWAFGAGIEAALLLAVGLAQIGEFSFILADLGIELGVLAEPARHLILGASILSILLNPFVFAVPHWLTTRLRRPASMGAPVVEATEEPLVPTRLRNHAVLVGYGRVGKLVGEGLDRNGWPVLVIEGGEDAFEQAKAGPSETIRGNAADGRVLAAANLREARLLLVAIPNAFEAGQIVEQARAANPRLEIIARAHFDAEVEHLRQHGADMVIMGEREIARSMLERAIAHARAAE